ncbi:hypothetical protein [Fulvimonas soli]|uniref:PH (Pleckstrin Homology) domain-containing protein n=1 Tax=Fulvimonas soli TaxID=155197 RepID=A0A316I0W4_9GAMM|nr:hypothetical protein [Fulvimonas soli]PWK85932.1 hypothetical protein C7456_108228 [Fulvimonas soli]TNY26974.1 hypothetical protein BV497_05815 [Fulvimonas soli]
MQRLSSPSTFFYKRVFPVLWFGLLAVFAAVWAGGAAAGRGEVPWIALLAPLGMMAFGFVLFRRLLADLADEVWLDGRQLVVKQRGEQSRIDLGEVINVNATTMTNPPRITLMLRHESARFGKTVSFVPAGPRGFLAAFRPHPVAVDLIHRIDALRQGAA